jgi:hypothetical protein
MKIKTNIKSGAVDVFLRHNHNQTLVREAKKRLRVKTNVKAGHKL